MRAQEISRAAAARPVAALAGWGQELALALFAGVREHMLPYALALSVWGAAHIVALALGVPKQSNITYFMVEWLPRALFLLCLSAIAVKTLTLALVERHRSPARALGLWIVHGALAPRRVAAGMHALAILFLLLSSFAFIKDSIPLLVPFYLDTALMRLDHALFLGHHPWRVLQPLVGYPLVTAAIDLFYRCWIFVMFGFYLYAAFAVHRPRLRMQYLIASVLGWGVGGCLLAVLLSSAGPCFYGQIGLADSPYTPLMAYLERVQSIYPIWALDIQRALWDAYNGRPAIAGGISAMPSMHLLSTTLFIPMSFRISRTLGIVMSMFAAIIFIGSIHLGWHYALDGVAGIAVALAIWHAAGRLAAFGGASRSPPA